MISVINPTTNMSLNPFRSPVNLYPSNQRTAIVISHNLNEIVYKAHSSHPTSLLRSFHACNGHCVIPKLLQRSNNALPLLKMILH